MNKKFKGGTKVKIIGHCPNKCKGVCEFFGYIGTIEPEENMIYYGVNDIGIRFKHTPSWCTGFLEHNIKIIDEPKKISRFALFMTTIQK